MIYSSKCKDKDSQVHLTADEKDIVKLEKTLLVPCARAFFSTKTATTRSEEEDDDGLFCSKNDAVLTCYFYKTVAKHLSSYSPGLTATPLYTFTIFC